MWAGQRRGGCTSLKARDDGRGGEEREGVRRGPSEPRQKERVSVSDRGLHGLAGGLLIHGGVELTGERTTPPLMMAAKVGVRGRCWYRLVCTQL